MTSWIVTPIKAPEACKTRLVPALNDAARRELVGSMLRHVVGVAREAAGPGDQVLLLGPSRHGLPADLPRLEDPGGGLNAALATAAAAAEAAGVERLVIVAADLPRATCGDVAALLGAASGEAAIAPDRGGTGTNALSLPLPAAQGFRFAYGPGSFAKHQAEAARLGVPLAVIRSETLALDIDEPQDLGALAAP
jgi:2-phospho-L-lactate guanylyltransferase